MVSYILYALLLQGQCPGMKVTGVKAVLQCMAEKMMSQNMQGKKLCCSIGSKRNDVGICRKKSLCRCIVFI